MATKTKRKSKQPPKPRKLTKDEEAAIHDAINALSMSFQQLAASLWYFQQDSEFKGAQWGISAKEWHAKAAKLLARVKAIPDPIP